MIKMNKEYTTAPPCKQGKVLTVYIPVKVKNRMENYVRGRMPMYLFVSKAVNHYMDKYK